jgi:hypothetical protein
MKISELRTVLLSGSLACLQTAAIPKPPKVPSEYEIEVVAEGGEKWFKYGETFFRPLPLLNVFWNVSFTEIDIWRAEKKVASISVREVGTHAATTLFFGHSAAALDFMQDHFAGMYAHQLSVEKFQSGDRLKVRIPIEVDWLAELAGYYHGADDPVVAPWYALAVDYKEAKMFFPEEDHLQWDLEWCFDWLIHDRKVAAVKDGRIRFLRFENK